MHTLGGLCLQRARTHGPRPAVADDRETVTYAELARRAGLVAGRLRQDRLSVLAGPPMVHHDLAAAGPLPAARLAIAGGQVVPVPELLAVARAVGLEELVVGYGMTETCGTVALATIPVDGGDQVARMRPLPGIEVAVHDQRGRALVGEAGRVLVRGYNLAHPIGARQLDGNRAGTDRPDTGWFDTGDLGTLDEQGRLTVAGRLTDTVIVSGFNVHPREVEAVLATHPQVAQVAVAGVTDPRRGQRLVAFVVPTGPVLDDATLHAFARERPSAYKLPSEYRLIGELPLTPTGKLARSAVRRLAECPPPEPKGDTRVPRGDGSTTAR